MPAKTTIMSVRLNIGAWNSIFAVPTKIVDEGLKFSDGVKLKVLLYVLRNSDKENTDEMISKATGVSVTDIPETLDYWVNFGVLAKIGDDYTVAQNNSVNENKPVKTEYEKDIKDSISKDNSNEEITSPNAPTVLTEPETENQSVPKKHFAVSRPQKPDYVFTSQRLAVDEELGILVDEAQTIFGKVLSNADISTLLMLKDTCGLPLDVILMLIQYCVSIGKGNVRAVEKIGIEWADDGIYSVEAADNKIRKIHQTSKNFSIVSSAFGLKNIGSPTKKQLEYGDKWVGEWKFSFEMLREAYERCVDSKGQLSLRYIDAILKRWHSEGVFNLNDLAASEKLSAKHSANKQTSSIDYSKLNKLSIPDV